MQKMHFDVTKKILHSQEKHKNNVYADLKKSLVEKFGKKSGGGEQSKGCGAVRRVAVCPPTRPYFPANSTHNKRPFYPHNNLAFPHSPHHPLLVTRATPSPPGGLHHPPRPPHPSAHLGAGRGR